MKSKASLKVTYAYPHDPEQPLDNLGRLHWVMRWWVDSGLGRKGDKSGWRGQHFFINMENWQKSLARYGTPLVKVLKDEAAFDKLSGTDSTSNQK